LPLAQYKERFPNANVPDDAEKRAEDDPNFKITVIEAVLPENGAHKYLAVTEDQTFDQGKSVLVSEGQFSQSPFINFRWLKAPGEIYGRSPVMKALPDIKTANKVCGIDVKKRIHRGHWNMAGG